MSKQTRYYQIEAKDAVKNALQRGVKNCMLVMATGTGKTHTASEISTEYKKVLWLTHTEELIEQSAAALMQSRYNGDKAVLLETMFKFKGFHHFMDSIKEAVKNPMFVDDNLRKIDYQHIYKTIGIVKAEKMELHAEVVVASIQTIHRRLDKIPLDMFDAIFVDECHMAMAATWEKTINHFNYQLLLGLTATPFRSDGMPLSNIFDDIIYEYDILRAINDGFLCELEAIAIKTNINLDSVRTTGGELNAKDLAIVNNPARNKLIVDKYVEFANGRQFIAFCVDVQHAKDLCQTFLDRGIRAEFVVGDAEICPDRKDRIRRFKNNQTKGLTNCMVLTAGFDHPEVGCVIMACPTKSLTKFIQCVGRGTRLKNELFTTLFGQNCIILDCVDSTSRHRLVNCNSLDAGKDIEDRVFMTKDQKAKKVEEREERKRKLESERTKEEKIDLFDIPKVSISNSPRMKEPATKKQLAWIEKLGYDVINIQYTKGMCSEIISMQEASDAQKTALKKAGYRVTESLTIAEAQAAFNEINEKKGIIPDWKKQREERLKKPFADL